MTKKQIWLDCDGTWIDFYGVENWLDYLIAENPYPYIVAKPLVNLSVLARLLNKLQSKGYEIGIISWTSKNGSADFNEKVRLAKMAWFKKHIPSVHWDSINIIPYGTPKSSCGSGYLFDDETQNRTDWTNHGGIALTEKELISGLKNLLINF